MGRTLSDSAPMGAETWGLRRGPGGSPSGSRKRGDSLQRESGQNPARDPTPVTATGRDNPSNCFPAARIPTSRWRKPQGSRQDRAPGFRREHPRPSVPGAEGEGEGDGSRNESQVPAAPGYGNREKVTRTLTPAGRELGHLPSPRPAVTSLRLPWATHTTHSRS